MNDKKALPLEAFFFKDFNSSHISEILQEIYLNHIYSPFFIGKRDSTILDIGQNIGITSYYFKDFAKQVIGLEPSTEHRKTCEEMLKFNKITNVICLPYALSNINGKTTFYINPYNNTSHSLEPMLKNSAHNYTEEEVKTITFDSLFDELKLDKVDFCKLDVEGSESKIIASDGFKKVCSKIKAMVIEYHSWCESSQSNIEHNLQDLGFVTHRLKADANLISAQRI